LLAAVLDSFDGLHAAILAPGDLNADHVADVVAATRTPNAGFFGSNRERAAVLALSGVDGTVLWSRSEDGGFGSVLASAGDLDGDGAAEIAVSRTRIDGRDAVLVLSGTTGRTLFAIYAPEGAEEIGQSLAGGLDATGDRLPDLLIGARDQVLLVDGAQRSVVASAVLVENAAEGEGVKGFSVLVRPAERTPEGSISVSAPTITPSLGASAALLPDFDGDGRAEMALGCEAAPSPSPAANRSGITVQVGSSEPGHVFVVASADPARNIKLPSAGWCLQVLGDVDGDGMRELAATTDSFHLRVFELGGELVWEVDYKRGYMNGEGSSLAVLPDLDHDGAPELALGANETGLDCDSGFVEVYSGRSGRSLGGKQLMPVDAEGKPLLWELDCPSGMDVAALPDLNGDGSPELALYIQALQEVRAVSWTDGSIRWRVALEPLSKPPSER
jgi:hypothetical protein